jgi:hypothetical protein
MTLNECAFRFRCLDAVRLDDDEHRRGAKIDEARGICRRCFGMVRGGLRELGDDWDRLGAAVGDLSPGGEVHVSGSREPPMPLNGTVLALRSTLSEWCEAALWMVAEPLGIDVKERHKARGWPVKDAPVVAQAARVLPENLKFLLRAKEQPVSVWMRDGVSKWGVWDLDGIDVAMKLSDIHHEVNRQLGLANLRMRLALPCPKFDCGARGTLGIDNGTTMVNCTACGGQWSQAEYDWLAKMLLSDEHEKETGMLKYLLAEAQWKLDVATWLLAERDRKLYDLGRLSRIQTADLGGIDGQAVVELIREML